MKQYALAGNPNTGKTTLFNALTGSYEYVGNWSGVTVEKKIGELTNKSGKLVDLPGIYSLSPISKDEGVATQFLMNESFDGIINIVDASQLLRNLHLTIQLIEMNRPILLSLNMLDVASARGIAINTEKMADKLGVPVIPVVARTGKGTDDVLQALTHFENKQRLNFQLDYGEMVEQSIERLSIFFFEHNLSPRWYVLQLLDENMVVWQQVENQLSKEELSSIKKEIHALKEALHVNSMSQYLYQVRHNYIKELLSEVVIKNEKFHKKPFSEKLDAIATHPIFGIPLFLLILFFMFKITFEWIGTPLSDRLDAFFSGPLTDWTIQGLTAIGANDFIQDVVTDGIIAGVGGVLVFVPQIFALFFFISFIEDSGYMARVAVVMDRFMEKIGLNGKALIPLIIGFGCNVPGVMATRAIEQPKERLLTILISPLMSCSARLAVYALFVSMFFTAKYQAIVILSLYVLGIVVAIIVAKLFSAFVFKNESSVFVVELPPYRMPHSKTLLRSTWDKGKGFVKKAGTFILAGSIIIWLLGYTGPGGIDVPVENSFMALIGGLFAPLFIPLGFGTWQAVASLIPGFLAKEVVVASMKIIYGLGEGAKDAAFQTVLMSHYTPLSAYSFMAFILLYVPCLATVAVIRRELGSRKWTFIAVTYAFVVAYVVSLIIYQGGRLIGLE